MPGYIKTKFSLGTNNCFFYRRPGVAMQSYLTRQTGTDPIATNSEKNATRVVIPLLGISLQGNININQFNINLRPASLCRTKSGIRKNIHKTEQIYFILFLFY